MASLTQKKKRIRNKKDKPNKQNLKTLQQRIAKNAAKLKELAAEEPAA